MGLKKKNGSHLIKYRSASILNDNRVVFNIKGNQYRLVVKVNDSFKVIFIRFVGTYEEYNKIKAEKTRTLNQLKLKMTTWKS